MKRSSLPNYLPFAQLAADFGVPADHLKHLFARNHLRPDCWVWWPKWKEPRFAESSIGAWRCALAAFPVGSFPGPPPKLERPARTFRESRFSEPTPEELEQFLKHLPKRERERLRSLPD